jgi:hypothetical protein
LNDFQLDLQYSIENRDDEQLNAFYKKAFPLAEEIEFVTDLSLQKQGIDKIIRFKDGKELTVDEKKRRKDYGDILLELRSNVERNTLGWLYYSQCDFIVYAIIPTGTVFLLPVLLLRMAWVNNKNEWLLKYPKKYADNGRYSTENIPIPAGVLLEAINKEMKQEKVLENGKTG